MTGMEHAIEQAAEIIGGHVDHYIGVEPDQPLDAARALAEAGFLAPSPLRQEWGVRWDDHDIWGDMYNTRHEAEVGAGDEGTPVHRWVTDWETCDG